MTTSLTWFGWALIAFAGFSVLVTISTIGKERKPTGPNTAVLVMLIWVAIIVAICMVGTGHL